MVVVAQLTNTYKAKGILDVEKMELTEVKKESVDVHDLENALELFNGMDVTITISRVHDLAPKNKDEE